MHTIKSAGSLVGTGEWCGDVTESPSVSPRLFENPSDRSRTRLGILVSLHPSKCQQNFARTVRSTLCVPPSL